MLCSAPGQVLWQPCQAAPTDVKELIILTGKWQWAPRGDKPLLRHGWDVFISCLVQRQGRRSWQMWASRMGEQREGRSHFSAAVAGGQPKAGPGGNAASIPALRRQASAISGSAPKKHASLGDAAPQQTPAGAHSSCTCTSAHSGF